MAEEKYYNLCGGNNSMTSGLLMKADQLQHSANAIFDNIGLVEKTPGQALYWDLDLPYDDTATISNATPAVVTIAGHGLNIGSAIVFSTSGALPTGLTAGTTYYVIAAGFGVDAFEVSAAIGGSAINTSSAGSGVHKIRAERDVTKLQQVDTDYYALAGHALYKKNGAGKTGITPTAGAIHPYSSLEAALSCLFFVTSTHIINSYDGSAVSATKHLINAPIAVDFIKVANGRIFAFSGNRFYFSSYPRRVVTTIVGDHTSATTINVDSTIYLKAGNVIDIYDASGTTKGHDVTIATVSSLKTFTLASGITVANGDIIVYDGGIATDTVMWATDEETGDWYPVQGDDGNPTGAAEHAGSLLIIKNQSLWRYTETALTKIADIGTNAPETFRIVGKVGLFANNKGLYIVDGNDVTKVSTLMDKYFKGITSSNIPMWCAGVDSTKYRLWIGATTHESMANCEIVFDAQAQKYETRAGIDARSYSNFIVSSLLATYVGTSDGKILQIGSGLSNAGVDIEFIIKTRDEYLGNPSIIKLFRKVIFYTKPGSILDVSYSIDGGDFKQLGQITDPMQSFELFSERGVYITFLITEISPDQLPGILGYEVSGDRDEDV